MDYPDSIFAVICESGEYSDYTTWIAAAYFTKAEADALVERKRQEAHAIREASKDYVRRAREWSARTGKDWKFSVGPNGGWNEWYELSGGDPGYDIEADHTYTIKIPVGVEGKYHDEEP